MRKIAYRDMKPGDAVHVSLRGGGSRKGFYLGVDDEPAGLIVVNVLLSRDNERWQKRILSAFWVRREESALAPMTNGQMPLQGSR